MSRVFCLLVLLVSGCIDPFSVNTMSEEPVLVVDGLITDQPGPYTVRLSWTSGTSETDAPALVVTGADVRISDGNGLSVRLTESVPGTYVTDSAAIRGQIGHTYTLSISADGQEYQSTEEPLVSAGRVDTVYSEYEENIIHQTDPTQPQDALTFFVDGFADPEYPEGLTRWRWTGIYEVLTHPELHTTIEAEVRVPAPLPCSGYIRDGFGIKQIDECTCCTCWISEYSHTAVVSSNLFVMDNTFNRVAVSRIPVDRWRFYQKYYIEVEQLSVSEDVYEFWSRVSTQQQGVRNLFQPNAVKVQGNIRCTSDPHREVYGIFGASAIVRNSAFVSRNDLPKRVGQSDTIMFDCRYAFENAVNVRPPFW